MKWQIVLSSTFNHNNKRPPIISRTRGFIHRLTGSPVFINIWALFSGTTIARILSAVSFFLLARQLGPDGFGVYVSAISLTKISSVLFSLGLNTWLLRNGRNPSSSLSTASSICLNLKLGLGAIWFIGILLIGPFLKQDVFPYGVVVIMALSTWFDELANTGWNTFKVALRNRVTVWLMVGAQVGFLVAIILLWVGGVDDIRPYVISRAITSGISGLVTVWVLSRFIDIKWLPRRALAVLPDTFAFGLSEGLAVIYERADITIIGYWLGKSAAGFYAPAVSLMTTLFLLPQAMYEVILPYTSEKFAQSPHLIQKYAYRIILLSSILGALMSLGMTIMARPLVWLFYGREFMISGDLLTSLSTILVFKSVSFGAAAVLVTIGWQNRRVIVQAIAAGLNIGLNLALIQIYELWGVAYVYILTEAVLMLGYLAFYWRWQYLQPPPQTDT